MFVTEYKNEIHVWERLAGHELTQHIKKDLVHGCTYKYQGTLKQHVDDKTVTLSITILYWTWQNSSQLTK